MENTPESVGNQFGYLCPKCGKGDSLYITAQVSTALLPDGTDSTDSDTEWDVNCPAWCGCGWRGTVDDFKMAENFEGD